MSNVRFIGCLHFGHKWMASYRGFQDEFYHDEHLIEEWNKVVHKKDLTYILGDITMETPNHYYQLDRLKGRKIVVLGNHDRHQDVKELLKYVDSVGGMVDYKGFVLTHAPIHPSETSFCRGNIHAHIHHENELHEVYVPERYGESDTKKVPYPTQHKYYNVDAHLMSYKPKTIDELLNQNKDDMGYQGTFISESPTINRVYGEPITKTSNSHEASWNTKVYDNEVLIRTKDGRKFSVWTLDWRTYNWVVNTIQINTLDDSFPELI